MDIKKIFTTWPFRRKLLLLLLFVFLPAFGIIVASGLSQREDEIVRAQNNALLLTKSLAAQQEQIALTTKTMLSILAQLPEVQSLDAAACNRLFYELHQSYPFYSVIAAVKADGTVFAASSPFDPKVNLSDRKHIKDAIRTRDFSVGEYIVGRVSKVNSLNYTFPVLDAKNQLVAVLIAGFDLNEFGRFISAVNLPEGSAVAFTDHQGVRLYRLPQHEATPIGQPPPQSYLDLISGHNEEGVFEWQAMDGINRIWAYKQLRLKNHAAPYLYIGVGRPKDPIIHKANLYMLGNLAILGIAVLFALSLAWVFGNIVLIKPINRLVAATQRFGQGALDTRTGLPHSSDELGRLAQSFDAMASLLETRNSEHEKAEEALTQAYAEMEERVQGRTAELTASAAALRAEISERKQAEEALREGEKTLRALLDANPESLLLIDNELTVIAANRTAAQRFGKRLDEFIGVRLFDLFSHDVLSRRKPYFDEVFSTGRPVQFEDIREGLNFYTYVHPVLDAAGKVSRIAILGLDITERKQAEATLRSTRDYLENIIANSADSIGIVDRYGKFTRWNKAAEEIYGYTDEELKGRSAFDLYADPGELEVMLKQLRQHGFIRSYEITMRKKDGSVFPGSLSIRILRNRDNEVIGSIAGCRDLTETKQTMMYLQNEIYQHEQARQALLESEQKLGNIIDFLPDATFVIDTNGRVIAWNKAIEEMSGVKASDMVGKGDYEYALPFYEKRRPILVDLVLEPDKGIENYDEVEREDQVLMAVAHFPNFRGKETYLFGKASALIDLHGKIIGSIETIRDITALRKAETDYLQFSKLESMSILAGGIAHDFNNILTAILGNIGLAMLKNEKLGEDESLVQAEKACFRAKELSEQLLTFAKGGAPIKKVSSLARLVKESAKLALAGSQSMCDIALPDNLWSVEVDEGQINQVISNLLINADQAMPSGGIIKIAAGNIVIAEGADLLLPGGKYVKLTITDQGIGIPSQYLDKIFDPYFTTKQKGSGLGLATAYSIIKNHSGHIKVESQIGAGTTFEMFLPALEAGTLSAHREPVTPIIGQGRILVMDDDEKIREVLCRLLSKLGYEVDSSSDGSQALEKFVKAQESGLKFDVVILDLTVPGGMGGKETIEKLLRIDPQVKAIVSSGYSDDPIMAHFQEYGFSEVIAKPYRVVELSRILRNVMAKKGN